MENKKGQALVEFVLILPVIMMILCVIIDFSSIFYNKNHLEGILNDTAEYLSHGNDISKIDDFINNDKITVKTLQEDKNLTITLKQNITLITPFSKTFFKNPYIITTDRTIIYE